MGNIISVAEKIGNILFESKNEDLYNSYILLYSRLKDPKSFITFIGETSSGKSTLINGFLKQNLLPYGGKPVTGTVTQINCKDLDKTLFFTINRDSSISEIDQNTFVSLSKEPDDDLLRLYVETLSPNKLFTGLNIFDTPGFNSINIEHEEVLKRFIPESDVIIFVVSYKVGFGSEEYRFMSIIEQVLEKDKELPVLLIINRCPEGITKENNRVKEIYSHASDTLHREPEVFLVQSIITEDSRNVLPFSESLWNKVSHYANSKERTEMINQKSKSILINLADSMIVECNSKLLALKVDPEHISFLEEEIENLNINLKSSLEIVDKYINRLKSNLPKLITLEIKALLEIIKEEIYSSNKWIDKESCIIFINSHTIPFHTNKLLKKVEDYILQTFEQMDEALNEMADKTIFNLDNKVNNIKSPELSKLVKNISIKLGYKAAKTSMIGSITSLGGVGGYASGAGNLAKMVVSRVGKLFGHTFGREVYNEIGRQFTKQFMQKLNVVGLVVTEFISMVWDSNTWQKKLFVRFEIELNKFRDEIINDFKSENLPDYEKSNKKLVKDIYKSMQEEIKDNIENIKNKIDIAQQAKLTGYMSLLNEYKQEMEIL